MRWPWQKSKVGAQPLALAQSRPRGLGGRRSVRAKYDAAQTNEDNRKHWAAADALSADSANARQIRVTLRNRARYEVANNSYARGIVLTLANDTVGTGPRLQMLLDDQDELCTVLEREFARWAKAVDLAQKLRTMRMAKAQDGEAFAIFVTNPALPTAIKLDLRLIEADQVSSLFGVLPLPTAVDGIEFDAYGNPSEYHVLKYHPGGPAWAPGEVDRVPASQVIHLFRTDRPGQHRGIPEITPALGLFAQLRRFTLAVLDAAEMAADFAGILYTDAPANGEASPIEPMDTIELERRMLTTMPDGWKLGQVEAQQPATTYSEFKREILNEIARCLNVPYNIAACNSSSYNYSSGRLDHQTYYKSIRVEQSQLEAVVMDRILNAWMAEAVRVLDLGELEDWPHQWFWDGQEHVDPAKEAAAQAQRLESNTTTLATEYARAGKDWEVELRQRAREVALMKELGLQLTSTQSISKPEAPPRNGDAEA